MHDLSVIDRFLETFIRYIDSGFGLIDGEVAFLTAILIGIDMALAGVFWALDSQGNVSVKFFKKILYVGFFAYILNNFSTLAEIIFRSFAGLGLTVTPNGLTADDLLRPGRLAGIGFDAAWPLLQQAGTMIGFTTFFDNIVIVLVLLFAWVIVILAFFILAVQLFITILEFKLTALAGFVLVPFALWNRTSFLAERVLGYVITSGVKVMFLAVIVGIGAGFFADFTTALNGQEPNLAQAMSLVLAAITLCGIGIFSASVASGLVSGAPQLGAGAAVGTVGGIAAGAVMGAGAGAGAARMAAGAGMSAVRSGTALGAGARTAYQLGRSTSGETGIAGAAAGAGGVLRAGTGAFKERVAGSVGAVRRAFADTAQSGRQTAWRATGGESSPAPGNAEPSQPDMPGWARTMRREQRARTTGHVVAQSIRDGDKGGAAANPDISEER